MIQNVLKKITHSITEALFPLQCYFCKREGEAICKKCLSSLSQPITTPAPYVMSMYSFKDVKVKKIIHAIKYSHRKDLLVPCAQHIAKEIRLLEDYKSYILVPIPMPKLRQYMRGYNHADALAMYISRDTGLIVQSEVLIRNPNQSKKRQAIISSRKERFKNQHNAFIVEKNLEGTHIILIDDVTTTGATLHEARKKLLKQGAEKVYAFTIAH